MRFLLLIVSLLILNGNAHGQTTPVSTKSKAAKKKKAVPKKNKVAKDTVVVVPKVVIVKDTITVFAPDSGKDSSNPSDTTNKELLNLLIAFQEEFVKQSASQSNKIDSILINQIRKDSSLKLKLDTIAIQTVQEGFWKGFFKNTAYQWMYDKLLGKNEKSSASFLEIFFTIIALSIRFGLILYNWRKIRNPKEKDKKPSKLRFALSIVSWTIIACSLIPQTNDKEEQYNKTVAEINRKIKDLEKTSNEKVLTIAYTATKININTVKENITVQQINIDTLLQQFRLVVNKQEEVIKNQIAAEATQKKAEATVLATISKYAVSGFTIFILGLLIIFGQDVRKFILSIAGRIKQLKTK